LSTFPLTRFRAFSDSHAAPELAAGISRVKSVKSPASVPGTDRQARTLLKRDGHYEGERATLSACHRLFGPGRLLREPGILALTLALRLRSGVPRCYHLTIVFVLMVSHCRVCGRHMDDSGSEKVERRICGNYACEASARIV